MAESNEQAYFIALGEDRYAPTEHTGGAWRDDEQHLAPVVGLMVHHMERWRERHVDGPLVFSRLSFDVLGQIPRDVVELSTEVTRPGRTIELIETRAVIGGREIVRARGWLLQESDTAEVAGAEFAPMPAPTANDADYPFSEIWPGGFIDSVRAVQIGERRPGRARVWARGELPLVAGEPVGLLADFLKVVDTANGVATRVEPGRWMFPNVDLTIHLFRQPVGDWAGLDTRVAFGGRGIGVTSTVLHDLQGPVGTVQQSLTVRRLG